MYEKHREDWCEDRFFMTLVQARAFMKRRLKRTANRKKCGFDARDYPGLDNVPRIYVTQPKKKEETIYKYFRLYILSTGAVRFVYEINPPVKNFGKKGWSAKGIASGEAA